VNTIVEQEQVRANRRYLVWQCAELKNKNIKPGGRTPREGCLRWNLMGTGHTLPLPKWFQTSECKHRDANGNACRKRCRCNVRHELFDDEFEALQYIRRQEGL